MLRRVFIIREAAKPEDWAEYPQVRDAVENAVMAYDDISDLLNDEARYKIEQLFSMAENDPYTALKSIAWYLPSWSIHFGKEFGTDEDKPEMGVKSYGTRGAVSSSDLRLAKFKNVLQNSLKTIERAGAKIGKRIYPNEPSVEPVQGPVKPDKETNRTGTYFKKLLKTWFPEGEFTMGQAKNAYRYAYSVMQGAEKGGRVDMTVRDILRRMGATFSHRTADPRWAGDEEGRTGLWPATRDYVVVKLPKE